MDYLEVCRREPRGCDSRTAANRVARRPTKMGADANTVAAIAALSVAVVAFFVAFAQALQQYLVSGQLIRICDSVVYGKLPGQGHRVWQFSQFRFRVVYSIPQISLSPDIWLGISSHVRVSRSKSLRLPSLSISESETNQSSIAGEASWVSFTRAVQHASGQSLQYKMVEGDADRCPSDLPVVPMQLSMRDVVVVATMAGMDCTDVSFQSQSLSMQGDAGTITSSRHPVLGALIHFAPKEAFDDHGIRANNGNIDADWVARLVDIVPVAGCRYGLRDRKHFEEDESSWIKLPSRGDTVRSESQKTLSTSNGLRQRRRADSSQAKPITRGRSQGLQGEDRLPGIAASTELRRPQDGEWSFTAEATTSNPGSFEVQSRDTSVPNSPQAKLHGRFGSFLRSVYRVATSAPRYKSSTQVLPVSEPKTQKPQSSLQPVKGQRLHVEDQSMGPTGGPTRPGGYVQTHPRRESLTSYIADGRLAESRSSGSTLGTNQLLLMARDEKHFRHNHDLDRARTEYVANKWEEIFQQRRQERSRGRSQSGRIGLHEPGRGRRRSTVAPSKAHTPISGLGPHVKRRQLRLREDYYRSDTDRDEELDSESESLGTDTRRRSNGVMPRDDSQDGNDFPVRGRRRNSSLVKEGTGSKVLAYGDGPIQSDNPQLRSIGSNRPAKSISPARKPSPRPSRDAVSESGYPPPDVTNSHQQESSADSKPRRRVRMVSPASSREDDHELLSPADLARRELEPKSVLRRPTGRFPEDPQFYREGVAPLRSASQSIPKNARWTRIARRLIEPEALVIGRERFEERQDHVIVLRVLTKEEIEQYALKSAELRGKINSNLLSLTCMVPVPAAGKRTLEN